MVHGVERTWRWCGPRYKQEYVWTKEQAGAGVEHGTNRSSCGDHGTNRSYCWTKEQTGAGWTTELTGAYVDQGTNISWCGTTVQIGATVGPRNKQELIWTMVQIGASVD